MTKAKDTLVGEVMTRTPLVVDGMTSLSDALGTMAERGISALVVGRRDEGDELGLVLVADIARVVEEDRALSRCAVYEVMAKPAPSLPAQMKIKYAIRFMSRFALTHCVVLENRELVGIVTLRELTLRYAAEG